MGPSDRRYRWEIVVVIGREVDRQRMPAALPVGGVAAAGAHVCQRHAEAGRPQPWIAGPEPCRGEAHLAGCGQRSARLAQAQQRGSGGENRSGSTEAIGLASLGARPDASCLESDTAALFTVTKTINYCRCMAGDGWQPPRVLLAVDLVIFTLDEARLRVLLIERGVEPYRGVMALPGGFLRDHAEALSAAAQRELHEEAGLDASTVHLEQLGTYGEPNRDPRGRVVSVAYLAIAPRLPEPVAGTDAADARWTPVDDILTTRVTLAFDHRKILDDGLERARTKLEHSALATAFCEKTFTISDLQQVYEAVWGVRLDPRNFYRKVQRTRGFIVPAGPMRHAEAGRPARLFRAGPCTVLHPPMARAGQLSTETENDR
jgi:8-oxo-dGTP diphosphatase